jgi:hypothetical protein
MADAAGITTKPLNVWEAGWRELASPTSGIAD